MMKDLKVLIKQYINPSFPFLFTKIFKFRSSEYLSMCKYHSSLIHSVFQLPQPWGSDSVQDGCLSQPVFSSKKYDC